MSQSTSFTVLNQNGHKYQYGLELMSREKGFQPTTFTLYFCSIKYLQKDQGKFVADSEWSYCYNFDCKSGKLTYAGQYRGDFTQPGFRWSSETRIAHFENDKITGKQCEQAEKTAKRAYDHLLAQRSHIDDSLWRKECEPFLPSLEKIIKNS